MSCMFYPRPVRGGRGFGEAECYRLVEFQYLISGGVMEMSIKTQAQFNALAKRIAETNMEVSRIIADSPPFMVSSHRYKELLGQYLQVTEILVSLVQDLNENKPF